MNLPLEPSATLFKSRHFDHEIITLCVRWYVTYKLSYRDLVTMLTEVPRITPVVTEYRRHCLWCVACGARTQAEWPTTMPIGSFGPRVQATVGYLTGRLGPTRSHQSGIGGSRAPSHEPLCE